MATDRATPDPDYVRRVLREGDDVYVYEHDGSGRTGNITLSDDGEQLVVRLDEEVTRP